MIRKEIRKNDEILDVDWEPRHTLAYHWYKTFGGKLVQGDLTVTYNGDIANWFEDKWYKLRLWYAYRILNLDRIVIKVSGKTHRVLCAHAKSISDSL